MEKTFDKVECPFMILKIAQQTKNRREIPQPDNWYLLNPQLTLWWKTEFFSAKVRSKVNIVVKSNPVQ